MVGKMSKDIWMGVRKGTVVSFIPTLFGCFLGIPSLYVFSFFQMFFCDLLELGLRLVTLELWQVYFCILIWFS